MSTSVEKKWKEIHLQMSLAEAHVKIILKEAANIETGGPQVTVLDSVKAVLAWLQEAKNRIDARLLNLKVENSVKLDVEIKIECPEVPESTEIDEDPGGGDEVTESGDLEVTEPEDLEVTEPADLEVTETQHMEVKQDDSEEILCKTEIKTEQSNFSPLIPSASSQLPNREKESVHSCKVCGEWFSQERDYKKHILSHAPGVKRGIHSSGDGERKNRPKMLHEIRKLKCSVCNSIFREEEALKKHKSEEMKCDQCKKKFCTKSSLEKHMAHHNDMKPFCCEQCGLTFKSENQCKTHKQNVHESAPFSCHLCGKVLKHKKYMKYHMYSHTEDRAYSCEICGTTFRRPQGLRKHRLAHSNEKPFSCDICGKAYKDKETLEKHKITHNKDQYFRCEFCTKSFSFLSAMKRHIKKFHKTEKDNT